MVKKSQHSPPPFGVGSDHFSSPQSLAYFENIIRPMVREEIEAKVEAHFFGVRGGGGGGGEEGGGSGINENLRLRLKNKIPSTIFTMNDVEAENGKELQVELFDANNNTVVDAPHPLSSALIEVVVLDGEFNDEEEITHSNFNKSIVSQKVGERPLVVGDGKRFHLRNGVSSITNLSFTKNSSRSRTRNLRLGLRVIHEYSNNSNYPTVRHAVSNPFRVKDHRGQLNKKHHPPRGEDEVWRLEGIGRNGKYHKLLTSHGILNVDGFVKAHQRDYRSLRKLLGNRVSDKKWKTMVNHALQFVPITVIPTFDPPNFEENLVQNEGVFNQNSGASNGNLFQHQTLLADIQDFLNNPIYLEDYYPTPTLLSHGEASTSNPENTTSTCNQYFQGPCNKLVPEPK